MNCRCKGFSSIRHNELRNITAELLTETSSNVLIEPPLQQFTGEQLSHQVDIATSNVWSPSDGAFLMLGFIIHSPPPTLDQPLKYPTGEMNKRREDSITLESAQLIIVLSHLWYSQLLVGWDLQLLPFTNV